MPVVPAGRQRDQRLGHGANYQVARNRVAIPDHSGSCGNVKIAPVKSQTLGGIETSESEHDLVRLGNRHDGQIIDPSTY